MLLRQNDCQVRNDPLLSSWTFDDSQEICSSVLLFTKQQNSNLKTWKYRFSCTRFSERLQSVLTLLSVELRSEPFTDTAEIWSVWAWLPMIKRADKHSISGCHVNMQAFIRVETAYAQQTDCENGKANEPWGRASLHRWINLQHLNLNKAVYDFADLHRSARHGSHLHNSKAVYFWFLSIAISRQNLCIDCADTSINLEHEDMSQQAYTDGKLALLWHRLDQLERSREDCSWWPWHS